MAATANNAVKMAYVTGNTLPATVDNDTVYFVAGAQELYVGSVLIASHIAIDGKQDNITVTTSGTGDYVANVEWDSSTSTLTITKATLPTLSKGTATGTGGILGGISVSGHEITEAFISALPTGTTATAPASGDGDDVVATKGYVDDAVAGLTGAMHFIGVSTTAITDGGTESPTIDGDSVTPAAGDVVIYGDGEFVWTGSAWNLLGDTGDFVLKTTQVTAGTGLTGGGALSSDVTLSHQAAPATGTATDVTADSTGHLYVAQGVTIDSLGHVASVDEKDIFSAVEAIAQDAADNVALTWTVV